VNDSAPDPAPPRLAVIGGGITGLAAAHRLHELMPQAELALFEASPRLGGVLETAQLDGFLVERSADSFLTKQPAALDLCHRLAIGNELVSTDKTRRRALVVKDGRLLPIPEGFYLMSPRKLRPLLASPVLSLRGKLRLLVEPFVPRRMAADKVHGSDPRSQSRISESLNLNPPDESVASFARRRLGSEAFERLVQPLVAGIYTADPEKLSMAAAMPEFLANEREHGSLFRAARRTRADHSADDATGARYSLFVAPKNGMAALVQALTDRLPPDTFHLNAPVTSIRKSAPACWQLEFAVGSANPQSEISSPAAAGNPKSPFDAVLIALPAPAAARLIEPCDAQLAAELTAVEYAGCAVVSLGFQRNQIAHPLDGFGFVVPHVERRRIIAASFASQKFPGRAPADAVLIRVFIGGALRPELLDLSDTELRRLASEELADLLQIAGQPILADVARWPRSMPQYHVGHLDRLARIERLAANHPTLALAGNAYRGVGIPQCIASAESAAERLATVLARG
jgi:oxygen-dependent protoporphyrinogen oxidase